MTHKNFAAELEQDIVSMKRKLAWIKERSDQRKQLKQDRPDRPDLLSKFDKETCELRKKISI